MENPQMFRIRTITAFLSLYPQDFVAAVFSSDASDNAASPTSPIANIIARAATLLGTVKRDLEAAGYEVQTVRLATNPFGEYLMERTQGYNAANDDDDDNTPANKRPRIDEHVLSTAKKRLEQLDALLLQHNIQFCALGPACNISEIDHLCSCIVQSSPRISCSAGLKACDVATATAAAKCIHRISQHANTNGLDNFRFCVTAECCQPYIPFFPAAKSESLTAVMAKGKNGIVGFAIGLENGALARHVLKSVHTIHNIRTDFCTQMAQAIRPVQDICDQVGGDQFLGIDTCLNPSLEEGGSVAEAMEQLDEIESFGDPGTLAAAAAITQSLQSLPGIRRSGYCGLMLPVCEDQRLAQLAASDKQRLGLADLLSISSVCGVGVDTVPLAGNCSIERLAGLLLDMAGLADRWQKSLSCRVLPFPGKQPGDKTDFDSPFMVNTNVFYL